MLPRRLSSTNIQAWLKCPACWAERYIDKDKGDLSGNLLLGRVFSDALKALHLGENWQTVYCQKYEELEQLAKDKCGTLLSAPMDTGLKLLYEYVEGGIYQGVPEYKFTAHIKHLPVPVTGFFDLLERDSEQNPLGVIEFKSTAANWTQERVDTEIQGTLYWCAFWSLFRQLPHCTYVVFDLPRAQVLRFETKRTKEECLELLDMMNRIYEEMVLAHSDDGSFEGKCSKHREPVVMTKKEIQVPTWDWNN